MRTTFIRALTGALLLVLSAACSSPPPAPSAATASAVESSLPGGTAIAIELTAPADGALVASPPGSVHVAGTVSVGEGEPRADTALVYLLDASAASEASAECGTATTVLECEIAALGDLNARAVGLQTVGEVGAAIFAGGGQALDLSPEAGAQPLVAPDADANGTDGPDALEALGSVLPDGTASIFSDVDAGAGPTEVGSGLAAALEVAAASERPARIVVLLSASTSEAGPGPGDLVVPEGVIVRAFALPGTTCADGLADFAALGASGSGCEDVADPAALSGRVATVLDATLFSLELVVDGVAGPLPAGELPAEAPFSAPFETLVADLAPGLHELCARASGTDAGGTGAVEQCATVTVATIAVSPLEATHELGTPGQTATVTATVAAGEAGGVAGVPVVFTVKAGPNAGKTETVPTDAEGAAAFTYEARQHLEGLGTDEIEACFADAEENLACASATVTWQDTTPPVVACLPGPNPAGKVVDRRGGVSPSGFMELLVTDAVDPAPVVFVVDTGSGTVWGPFQSGMDIKYTQAPGGPPTAREMGEDEAGRLEILHLKGTGDPALRGEDSAGNESEPLVCSVPPWRK